jgi:hypothetical protein
MKVRYIGENLPCSLQNGQQLDVYSIIDGRQWMIDEYDKAYVASPELFTELFEAIDSNPPGLPQRPRYRCPCCEKHTFSEPDSFEKCPICGWVDDLVQRTEPDEKFCANKMSLSEAKEAYNKGEKNR